MISMLLYSKQEDEQKLLDHMFRDAVADLADDEIRIHTCDNKKALQEMVDRGELLDMGCLDVTGKEGVTTVLSVRNAYPAMEILLVADAKMSPLTYIRPGIRASSLLLRPFQTRETGEVMHEFLSSYLLSREADDDQTFTLRGRDGVIKLPYARICFVEARMKKIYIRTETEEFGYYDSLERLQESLPESFIRCHRGFIVNRSRIRKLDVTDNLFILDNGMKVPVSRGYKQAMKEEMA
ncbi:MAG: LytTR family transcriptional regulator [Lachnospiraceae bacterium]|nr:LytTR family transcriptional regulator [Lachnospiraceae bacterium]